MKGSSTREVRLGPGRGRPVPLGVARLALALAALAALPGCGGCRQDADQAQEELDKEEAEKRAKQKKPKPPFVDLQGRVPPRLTTRPSARLIIRRSTGTQRRDQAPDKKTPAERRDPLVQQPCKPGHWTAVTLSAKTNNFDFVGDLEIAAADLRGGPIPLKGTPFDLTTTRQVSLPKSQPKIIESVLFVPYSQQQTLVSYRLNWGKGGRTAMPEVRNGLARMPSYQYHLAVLARSPARYEFLGTLPSIAPPRDEYDFAPTAPYNRIVLIRADHPNPRPPLLLPSYGLLWTSISHVLWDDADPDALTADQQQALLDWLNWGGQLILSGPDTLETLRDSFLAPYLPATVAGVRQLQAADFVPLHGWASNPQITAARKPVELLGPLGRWTGVKLDKHPHARFVPGGGDLFVERRAGRGRIVVSAFRLSSSQLDSWSGRDEMFNAFLLGRPARKSSTTMEAGLIVNWADAVDPRQRFDAARVCNLRYFARDTGVAVADYSPETTQGTDAESQYKTLDFYNPANLPRGPGVAAWNDSGAVAASARSALRSAAQIKIPDRSHVLWILAGYLVVLVPVNWVVFRVLGRVEWAWIAAPLIAIACTVLVIRAAQLDIGFVRSRTEIALVEVQADYTRAHVTRYTALYTSLTTDYDLHFDDPGGLAQPFAGFTDPSDRRGLLYGRGENARLEDYFVRSHSTGAVHSEQMVDLGGSLSLSETPAGGGPRWKLSNQTRLTLHQVGVIRKDKETGDVQTAYVPEDVGPGMEVPLTFRPSPEDGALFETQRGNSPLTGIGVPPRGLNLRGLAQLAQDVRQLAPGQVRLVAAIEQEVLEEGITGPTIDQTGRQSRAAGLLIAHLKYGFDRDPLPDVNRISSTAGQYSTIIDDRRPDDAMAGRPDPRSGPRPPAVPEPVALSPSSTDGP